jgi:peroxiredoxin
MKQLVQLQEHHQEIKQAGINLVALTYDAPDLQQVFVQKNSITYPLLSDINATSIKALDILNTKYQPSDDNYGIPYPGIYVVNPQMEIVGKIFVEAYSTRVDAAGVLAYAQKALALNY